MDNLVLIQGITLLCSISKKKKKKKIQTNCKHVNKIGLYLKSIGISLRLIF